MAHTGYRNKKDSTCSTCPNEITSFGLTETGAKVRFTLCDDCSKKANGELGPVDNVVKGDVVALGPAGSAWLIGRMS